MYIYIYSVYINIHILEYSIRVGFQGGSKRLGFGGLGFGFGVQEQEQIAVTKAMKVVLSAMTVVYQ